MDFPLFPFQVSVGQAILSGKNVILQAPPGAGKTRAALNPFFNGLENNRTFPKKCLYAVPMRVLANQFVEAYGNSLSKPEYKLINQRSSHDPLVDIQTGEQRRDPRLEAALTFVTIDQLLSSFLGAPYSLPRRLANLNTGAVLSSYLVLDEFHLYDPQSTLPTALEMLRILNRVCPFILMTATFSTPLLTELAQALNATVIGAAPDEQAEFTALPSQQKERRYISIDEPLSAVHVLRTHLTRSIVLCNTVERAQIMARSLRESAPDGVEVILLHSRFLAEDRRRIETHIRRSFGSPRDQGSDPSGSLILVATQVIEVGLDITSQTLHTELAPANAIIQRAGRCARYQGETGNVYVYQKAFAPDGEVIDLSENTAPYTEQKDVLKRTWDALAARAGTLDYVGELAVIETAHGEADKRICEQLRAVSSQHRDDLFSVMVGGQRDQASRLIREMFQQKVVIHDDPQALLDQLAPKRLSPYSLDGFGLHPGTAAKYVKDWQDRPLDNEPSYRVAMLTAQPDPEQNNRTVYSVTPLSGSQKPTGAAVLFVHPDLAGYDFQEGFLPGEGCPFERPLMPALGENTDKPDDPYGYRLETYELHIQRVYEQFDQPVWQEVAYAAARIEHKYGLALGRIHQMAKLAVILHDTGKLNQKWQSWVREWQTFIGLTDALQNGSAFAHTDNYTPEHRRLEREFRTANRAKRPPHAVEGAVASLYILSEALDHDETLLEVVFTAIARHHSPDADTLSAAFTLEPRAVERTAALLKAFLPELSVEIRFPSHREQEKEIEVKDFISQERKELPYLLTMLLSRVLRRADQRGTQTGIVKE